MDQIFFFSEDYLNKVPVNHVPVKHVNNLSFLSSPNENNYDDQKDIYRQTNKSENLKTKELYYMSAHLYCNYNVKNLTTIYEDICSLKSSSNLIKVWIDQNNKEISLSMLFDEAINFKELSRYVDESLWNMDLFIDQILFHFPKYLVFQKNGKSFGQVQVLQKRNGHIENNYDSNGDITDEICFDSLVRLCFELKKKSFHV